MQFSDTTDNQGILQSCESWVFAGNYGRITGNDDKLDTFTRLCNRALDNITNKILSADTRWEFDDSTNSDYPIATTDYVNGQQDYDLSASHMKIIRVEGKDSNGNYRELKAIDQSDIEQGLTEYYKEDGVPSKYDKSYGSVWLYPAPDSNDVDTTSDNDGLKVYFQREPNYFSSSDTTKEPGFANTFHDLIAMWASYTYCQQNQMFDKAQVLRQEITEMERQLQDFYNRRDKDERPALKGKKRNWK